METVPYHVSHQNPQCHLDSPRGKPTWSLYHTPSSRPSRHAGAASGVLAWTAQRRVIEVAFASEPLDPFFNVNSPKDLAAAERRAPHDSFDRHSNR